MLYNKDGMRDQFTKKVKRSARAIDAMAWNSNLP